MLRNKLVRSDGSIIDSSVIISCEFTEEVNSTTNLTVGDATASELTVEILNTVGIRQDEVLTYYIIEDDAETKIGVFNVEKPTVATRTSMRFSAYDNIAKTEKIFSDWLRENQGLFPMTLYALVGYACSHCGVTFASTTFPQADLSVNDFYADDLSCRQILTWAAAIAGRFVRANANGGLEFAWYEDATNITVQPGDTASSSSSVTVVDDGKGNISITSDEIALTDDGEGNVTMESDGLMLLAGETGVNLVTDLYLPYFQGSLSYENYTTDRIERVQVKHSEDDVGVIYPPEADGNCFSITENMILGVSDTANVTAVATSLYTQLKDITYVPFSARVRKTGHVRAGTIINVMDSNGNAFSSYVMKVTIAPGGTTLTSTGDKSYGSNVAVSSEKYSNLIGKILAIKKSVDGLEIKNEDLTGKIAALSLTTEGLDSFVGDKIKDAIDAYDATVGTRFQQTKDGFDFQFGVLDGDLAGLSEEQKRQYEERAANIRFEDGNIILGRASSEIMLILKNNRISFVKNDADKTELAYISNNILYITEGEFLSQLRIGKFGFTPGANGNLSFKKVVD
jgi:hypothetical protein